jgi:hypothetical protein
VRKFDADQIILQMLSICQILLTRLDRLRRNHPVSMKKTLLDGRGHLQVPGHWSGSPQKRFLGTMLLRRHVALPSKCAGSSGPVHNVVLIDVYLDLETLGGRDFG